MYSYRIVAVSLALTVAITILTSASELPPLSADCLRQRANIIKSLERILPLPSSDQFYRFEIAMRYAIAAHDTECARAVCKRDVRECAKVRAFEEDERRLLQRLRSFNLLTR